ncbi:MAG: hypothetical protein VKJ09_05940 [Leptolyngbya sp.]|nr:hypothetical protein [Leptolyngbya sp.]
MQAQPFDHQFSVPSPATPLPTAPLMAQGTGGGWWDTLFTRLAGSNQPRIRQTVGRNGQPQWQVYDPVTGDRHQFPDEESVRIWLEQRYNGV